MVAPVVVPQHLMSIEIAVIRCTFNRLVGQTSFLHAEEILNQMTLPLSTSDSLPAPNLTAREIQILREWVMRDSKSDVAGALFITAATVSTHVNRIRIKYAAVGRPANTKASLLARALQDGHVDLDEL